MVSSSRTEKQTDRHTDTKVTTEGTLSGFQDFFLQPIIKDRPKNGLRLVLSRPKLGLEPKCHDPETFGGFGKG